MHGLWLWLYYEGAGPGTSIGFGSDARSLWVLRPRMLGNLKARTDKREVTGLNLDLRLFGHLNNLDLD